MNQMKQLPRAVLPPQGSARVRLGTARVDLNTTIHDAGGAATTAPVEEPPVVEPAPLPKTAPAPEPRTVPRPFERPEQVPQIDPGGDPERRHTTCLAIDPAHIRAGY